MNHIQGPPPPQLPAGWKAIWNDQYQAWFYANTVTKETTWEKPTEPAYPSGAGGPPGYDHTASSSYTPHEKNGSLASNNPYGTASPGPSPGVESDEAMARRLQQQEQAAQGSSGARGASDGYYGGGGPSSQAPGMGSPSPYGQQSQLPPREEKRGLLSSLKSKLGSGGSRPSQQQHYGGGGYPQQGYGHQPMMGGGGYPQQGGMYGQQPMMGGGPMYGGGYPQQQMMYGQPQRRPGGGGMGMGGGLALGAGAGMLGGMAMGSMMANDNDDYQDGYQDG